MARHYREAKGNLVIVCHNLLFSGKRCTGELAFKLITKIKKEDIKTDQNSSVCLACRHKTLQAREHRSVEQTAFDEEPVIWLAGKPLSKRRSNTRQSRHE